MAPDTVPMSNLIVWRRSLNIDDEKKLNPDEVFGPDDNSLIAKVIRGEVELEYPDSEPIEHPMFWETMSMRSDQTIVNCVNGQYKLEYRTDNPDYQKILGKIKEQFPDLAVGRVCTLNRYRDGRTEITTEEYR